MTKGEQGKATRSIALGITIPFMLAVPPLIGWWIGKFIDQWLDSTPIAAYLFLVLGLIAGVKEVWRLIKKIQEEQDDE